MLTVSATNMNQDEDSTPLNLRIISELDHKVDKSSFVRSAKVLQEEVRPVTVKNRKRELGILDKSLDELSVKEVMNEIDYSLKSGQPVRFRDFGYKSTAIVKLNELEKREEIPKKKDYMKDIEI